MNYLIIFKNDDGYLNLNNFEKLKTKKEYEYNFASNYLLITNKNKKENSEKNNYIKNQLKLFKGSKDKINVFYQTINILNGIISSLSNTQLFSLEIKKNKLTIGLQDFIDYTKTNDLYEELGITEDIISLLKQTIINGRNNSKYEKLESFVNDNIKKIRETINQLEKEFKPDLETYESNSRSFLNVKEIFNNLGISNKSKYYTSQYFQTIDENISGYYNVVNYNSSKNIILQTHFFDDILDKIEYSDLFYEYVYLLYKPKLTRIIRKDNITQEQEGIDLNKKFKKEYLNLNKRLSISQEDYIKNKIQEYYEDKELQLKNDSIEYLKGEYEYNTKILQQINKAKKDYSNILNPNNTTVWYIHLNFDIEKTYNLKAIDKIQKPLKKIDSKDTSEENCNKSKEYFQSSWVDSIDNQLYNLVHEDPKKLKTHLQNFKNYVSNLF